MHIPVLGSAGLGLVWGWLAGRLGGRARRPWLDAALLSAASVLLAGEVLWLTDGRALLLFAGAALPALWLHLAWRHELRTRHGAKET